MKQAAVLLLSALVFSWSENGWATHPCREDGGPCDCCHGRLDCPPECFPDAAGGTAGSGRGGSSGSGGRGGTAAGGSAGTSSAGSAGTNGASGSAATAGTGSGGSAASGGAAGSSFGGTGGSSGSASGSGGAAGSNGSSGAGGSAGASGAGTGGANADDDGGCSCSVPVTGPGAAWLIGLLGLLLGVVALRRRASAERVSLRFSSRRARVRETPGARTPLRFRTLRHRPTMPARK